MAGVLVLVLVAVAIQLLLVSSFSSAKRIPNPPDSPSLWIRETVVVYGFVHCSPCKLAYYSSYLSASPLPGAVVMMRCNFTHSRPYKLSATAREPDGLFTFEISRRVRHPHPNLSFDMSKCKVFLSSSPSPVCQTPTNFNWGISGAEPQFNFLKNATTRGSSTEYHSVDILFFGPTNATSCPARTITG